MSCNCAAATDEPQGLVAGLAATRPDLISAVMAHPLIADIPKTWVPGWEERNTGYSWAPRGVVAHHTGGGSTGDYPALGTVRDGRSDLPGPLSQFGLGRNPSIWAIAAGHANHAGPGGWRGLSGNASVVGIEAENNGSQPWPEAQVDAYLRLIAAICLCGGWGAEYVCCHKEWTPAKPDPHSIDGGFIREAVAKLMRGGAVRNVAALAAAMSD